MKHILVGLLLFGWLAGAVAAREPIPGNPDRGMLIFSTYCAACHGEDGRGDGPVAARLGRDHGVFPADLTRSEFQNRSSDGGIAKAIREGGVGVHRTPYMPAWGLTLTDKQINDLVAFVRELGVPVKGEQTRGSFIDIQSTLELGRVLYGLHCAACHGAYGKGDGPFIEATQIKAPPSLANATYYAEHNDRQLARWVNSGTDHAKLIKASPPWWHRVLDEREVQALILYLRCLPLQKSP